MQRKDFEQWVQGYLKAWSSNSPADIEALFTEDATYLTQAFREPWRGRAVIVKNWMQRTDDQGSWEFAYEIVAAEGDLGVLEGVTTYTQPADGVYKNIWFIRLDADGRCREFKEFWIQKEE
jgi:ketosteroid isomerase-like protein